MSIVLLGAPFEQVCLISLWGMEHYAGVFAGGEDLLFAPLGYEEGKENAHAARSDRSPNPGSA